MRRLIALALLALALAGGVAFVGKHMQRLRERRDRGRPAELPSYKNNIATPTDVHRPFMCGEIALSY